MQVCPEVFEVRKPVVSREQTSSDRTRKWLVKFADGNEAETVYIPEDDRGAICISSQVGCTLTCTFCHTGTQKLVRNLTAGEIVDMSTTTEPGRMPSMMPGTPGWPKTTASTSSEARTQVTRMLARLATSAGDAPG